MSGSAAGPAATVSFRAVDDEYTVGGALRVNAAAGLLANDSAPDGTPVLAEIGEYQTDEGGEAIVQPDGSFTYAPKNGFTGLDRFTYTIEEAPGSPNYSTATVNLNVVTAPSAFRATDDAYMVVGTLRVGAGNGLLANDASPGFPVLTDVGQYGTTKGGVAIVKADGSFTYTPPTGFTGVDSFKYTIAEAPGSATTATANVTLVVEAGPNPLRAENDSYSVRGTLNVGAAAGLLANDASPDGTPVLTDIGRYNTSEGGVANVHPDGSFTYTPAAGFLGEDRFTYTIAEAPGSTNTATATVTLEVEAGPGPLQAVGDSYTVQDSLSVGAAAGLLANDVSPDGTPVLTEVGDYQTAKGSVAVVQPDGSFTYTPPAGFTGVDSFTYTIEGTSGSSVTSTASVTLDVEAGPSPFRAVDDTYTFQGPLSVGAAAGLLANDVSPDGTPVLTEVGDYQTAKGSVAVVQPDGSFTYTPPPGFTGVDSFTYSIDETPGSSIASSATVTLDVEGPACYCRGTLIKTVAGDVAVEDLAIGDLLVTAAGSHRPVKWIGHRSYAGRFANAGRTVLPICFRPGSLGEDTPRRDLWVSPKHAMFLDGALIAAEHLVNGISVVQADRVDVVEYVHVELDSHDVIVAEGAFSETYVDDDNRAMFRNAHTFRALYPAAPATPASYCAPRLEDGFQLEAVRCRLLARAGRQPGPRAGEPTRADYTLSPRQRAS